MRQIVLKAHPVGSPVPDDFDLVEAPRPNCPKGGVVLRTLWLSLDPLIRFTLDEKPLTSPYHVKVGDVVYGGALSQVVESDDPRHPVGQIVEARSGWREYAAIDPEALRMRPIDASIKPKTAALGILGGPGMTAYAGMVNTLKVKAGETLVISAAAGAVGTIAGQIGKILGARVVGIAGGEAKCKALIELGFDAAVDYRAGDYPARLAAACPDGIDAYFENVGGEVTQAVLPLFSRYARMAVCGFIAYYGVGMEGPGPDRLPGLMRTIMSKALESKGFSGMLDAGPDALPTLARWMEEGRIDYPVTIVEGLENTPEAFAATFSGNRNIGKLLVKVADET